MTNLQVVHAWAAGRHASAGRLHTDGRLLHSYDLKIGEWRDGLPVVFNYTARLVRNGNGPPIPSAGFYSKTTSTHVWLAHIVAEFASP